MAQDRRAATGLQLAAHRRGSKDFDAAGRHSRRVRLLKFAIPAFALIGAALFASATVLRAKAPADVETDSVSLSDGRIVMVNPKLDGMTGDKRPYTMQAVRAYQEVKKDGVVELESITADLPFGDKATATLKAGGGIYSNTANHLDLNKDIALSTSDGMTATLKSASIDLGKNTLSTSEPVDITRDGSHITADSLEVSDGGKKLVFERRVRLTIDPKKLPGATLGADAAQSQ